MKIASNDAPLYTEVSLVLKQLYKEPKISRDTKVNRLRKIVKECQTMIANL